MTALIFWLLGVILRQNVEFTDLEEPPRKINIGRAGDITCVPTNVTTIVVCEVLDILKNFAAFHS